MTGRRGKERVAKIDDKDDNGFSDESRVTVRRDRDGERRGKYRKGVRAVRGSGRKKERG